MFENLSERLTQATRKLTGRGRLTDENISDSLRQVRMALLEADVALPVVKDFVDQVRLRAVGTDIGKSLSPGQMLIKMIHGELVRVMGDEVQALDLSCAPPAVILLAGLQGAGKTTTAAKLARRLIEKEKKKVLLVSADVYRPAAILQLQKLSTDIGAGFFPSSEEQAPVEIVAAAIVEARVAQFDILIVDTAGRLHVDDEMMDEIRAIHAEAGPIETLFVVDSMAGQDAVNAARAFSDALPLTGVVLSKTDGDARGGAALSVRQVTGAPIKFLGTGEHTESLEAFHPDRIASRILGMGDVLTLVEEVEQKIDRQESEKLARKLRKGKDFNFTDLRSQLEQMQNLGGLGAMFDKLPGGMTLPAGAASQVDERAIKRQIAIINSMTPGERRFPKTIDGSRKRRIAAGSGTGVQDVNRLIKQQTQMQRVMKRLKKKGGMNGLMQALGGGRGGVPGGKNRGGPRR